MIGLEAIGKKIKENFCQDNLYFLSSIVLKISILSLVLLIPFVQDLLYTLAFSKANMDVYQYRHIIASKELFLFPILLLFSILIYGLGRLFDYKKLDFDQKIHFWTMVACFFIIFVIHQYWDPNFGDDEFMTSVLDGRLFSQYVLSTIKTWQTRIVGLYTAKLVRLNPIIWRLLDSLCMVTIIEGIVQISLTGKNKKYAFSVCLLLGLIPVSIYKSAGWIMTTTTYVWPLAFLMPSFIIIKKEIIGKESRKYEYILSFILAAIGATELSLIPVILVASFLFIIYQIFLQKNNYSKPSKYIVAIFILSILEFAFAFLAPGNAVRSVEELKWFPEFPSLSILNKLKLGILITMPYFYGIASKNFIILPLEFALFVKFYSEKKWKMCICQIPSLFIIFVFGFFPLFLNKIFSVPKFFYGFKNIHLAEFCNFSHANFFVNVEILFYIVILFLTLYSLYMAVENRYRAIFTVLVFLAGFLTRFILCFSPTVYASGFRTSYYWAISVFICSAIVWENTKSEKTCITLERGLVLITIFLFIVICLS
ncbi:MAG: hypothetical protein IJJ71_09230 [Treponema sp.]|uniref:DUF6056 family protein n=1 Tax=Treponema sp. TaxID=166 RepID=UPI0025EBE901|nr:DUF6056 family protein [Treponema sp.]MBR0496342.1 hypothetical protein [Treponema sp.]